VSATARVRSSVERARSLDALVRTDAVSKRRPGDFTLRVELRIDTELGLLYYNVNQLWQRVV
jgi:hypothetical protein